ncbi:MAG: hypothetical protein OXU72_12675 [Gammaproteobacteria bacterium]|nr:hypothetical protein [Gammaproteobacteria bacterium]
MRKSPEAKVKSAIAGLLGEVDDQDWAGEANGHFKGMAMTVSAALAKVRTPFNARRGSRP